MELQTSVLFLTASINAILALFVLFGTRTRTNLIYSIFVVFVAFWAIGLSFFILEADLARANLIANFYYVAAASIPTIFLYFAKAFLNEDFRFQGANSLLAVPLVILGIVFILDPHFLVKAVFLADFGKDVVINHFNYVLYSAYFLVYLISAYYYLLQTYRAHKDKEERLQINFVVWGTAIAFLLGMVFNLILPFTGDYSLIWLGPVFTLIMVISIGFAIVRHHLFSMKVIATEFITFSLWITVLVRTLLTNDPVEQVVSGLLLIFLVIFGTLLIRSVLKEVETRERIERLAKQLETANGRLKELDQLKSEFLSIASHQIRAPITAIKGYASLIMEGNFGVLNKELKEAIDVILQSSSSMAIMVDDFLNISRIEQGQMKYDFTLADVSSLVSQVCNELKPNAEKRGISLAFRRDETQQFSAVIDIGKIKQAITNIVDNSIKYTPKGSVLVQIQRTPGNRIDISVKDTGVGIAPENIDKLFAKFSRAKNGISTNVSGTGLGLYVVKQMVEAHKGGKVWVESPGEGKGSTFHIELQ